MQHTNFISSVKNAIKGLRTAFREQRNLRIQAMVAVLTIFIGIWLKITRMEWAIIFTCIGLVMGLELLNSAIEVLLDKLHPDKDAAIGKAKDIAAAAVLLASVCSVIAGFWIFYVRISALFH
ncbi:MAG: diacylglycerol kinase family protein [Bacteroidetes bacterium]|jgi:diacylglycerol kinase|nr:diacylglycerol kinase family protein [Bacteroidota bacterium]